MHCKDTILRTQNNWPYSKLIPNSGIALHSNGAIAIETTTTGANFNRTFYDENGNTIEEREFEKKYRDLCKSLKHKLPID